MHLKEIKLCNNVSPHILVQKYSRTQRSHVPGSWFETAWESILFALKFSVQTGRVQAV